MTDDEQDRNEAEYDRALRLVHGAAKLLRQAETIMRNHDHIYAPMGACAQDCMNVAIAAEAIASGTPNTVSRGRGRA